MVGEQQLEIGQVICWDRGRPARKRAGGAKVLDVAGLFSFSRFALIAGGTPAVPDNHVKGFKQEMI